MTLRHGREYLAIPGPSVVPDRVLRAMMRPAPNIYAGELLEVTARVSEGLCRVARTRGRVAIYIGNGHAAWEAALANCLSRGDRVLVLATGRFGHGWAELAKGLGLIPEVLDFGRRQAADPVRLAARLAADRAREIRAVLITHTDTATSVRNDVAALAHAVRESGHPALLMVDCIASLACEPFEMDAWGVDVTVSACQKGLMTPPGVAFVWFNGRAAGASARADLVTPYWNWGPRAEPEQFYQRFAGTAPTHHLYALDEALRMILEEEGLEAVWARHARLARAVWAAAERWAEGGELRLNLDDPAIRSHAVTTLATAGRRGAEIRAWVEAHAGVTLGIGLGMDSPADPQAEGAFRIGHMGHVNAHMVLGALGAIEAAMAALGIPRGQGALEAAAAVMAGG